ncbi:MAG: hypothetical protein AAGG75_06045 [Bacteroidota bacterium]
MKTRPLSMARIIFLVGFLFAVQSLYAQVFPVRLTGATTPPRSLDLRVYGNERAQDLFFNAVLNDPVEPTLQVYPRLSVERSGQIIYQTDPNFFGTPITLSQFDMQMIDGADLQPYLRAENLLGANANGGGAVEVPEGFIQICLQLSGVERNVPVSNKFCVSGNFQLNQAPQLIFPACGEQLQMQETQNMLFNWQPQHLASANSPQPVEYEFELVQLPDGYFNANDAFERSLRIFQTRTMMPNLLYTQAEPLLEAGKLYAWRVRAFSALHPTSKLFNNDGISEICTFRLYKDEPIDQRITVVDNPSPVGCSVFNTDYGPVTSTIAESVPLAQSDIVKLGYFNLELGPISGSPSGYSGEGEITFPLLQSKIAVTFSGLRVNEDKRVFEAEKVEAVVEPELKLYADQLAAANIRSAITDDYIDDLYNYFTGGKGQRRLVSGLNLSDPVTQRLPIGLDQDKQPTVAVIGIEFTPRSAYLHLASWSVIGQGTPIRFAATAVPATPHGMKSKAHLVALGTANIDGRTEKITEAFEITYSGDSRMYCDCKGYKEQDLEKGIRIAPKVIARADNGAPVVLDLKRKKGDIETYLGDVQELPEFKFAALPDFVFQPRGGKLDLRTNEKANLNSNVMERYNSPQNIEWRGLAMKNVALELPPSYNLTGKNEPLQLESGELFINEEQLAYGLFTKNNLLSLSEGRIEKWAYSVDQLRFEIPENLESKFSINGQLKTPIFEESFQYESSLREGFSGTTILDTKLPADKRTMGLWKANFQLNEESTVAAQLKLINDKRKLYPRGEFSGQLNMARTNEEVQQELLGNAATTISSVQSILGISKLDFTLSDLSLNAFKIDPYMEPAERYLLGGFDSEKAKMSMGGKALEIAAVQLRYEAAEEGKPERLGLAFDIVEGNNRLKFIFWAKANGDRFDYQGIEVEVIEVRCECVENEKFSSIIDYDQLYDRLAEQKYQQLIQEGTLSNSIGGSSIDFDPATLKSTIRATLVANTIAGFPMLDEGTLLIPWLGANGFQLEVEDGMDEDMNIVTKGVKEIEDTELTFAKIDARSEQQQLPIDVTDKLHYLGINNKADGTASSGDLPASSRLLITDFFVESKKDRAVSQGKMVLTLLQEIEIDDEKKYLRFLSKPITVTDQKSAADANEVIAQLGSPDIPLELQTTVTQVHGGNDIIFQKKPYSANGAKGSFARITCDDGFVNYHLEGVIKFRYEEDAESKVTQLLKYDIESESGTINGTKQERFVEASGQASIRFVLDSGDDFNRGANHSLSQFIAGLEKTDGLSDEEWGFSTFEGRQLTFVPGENFLGYLDLRADKVVSVAQTSEILERATKPEFIGLVFNRIHFEVIDLNGGDGEALSPMVSNALFDFAANQGFFAKYENEEPLVKKADKASFAKWGYTLEKLQFEIRNNVFFGSEGVLFEGSTHIPLFAADPPQKVADVTFAEGYVPFKGEILYDQRVLLRSQVDKTAHKIFYSEFIPGLGFRLNNSSQIDFLFDVAKGEFESKAAFNGISLLVVTPEVLADFNLLGSDQDTREQLDFIDFVFPFFSFNGLTINMEEESCGKPFRGIQSLNFGTWGVLPEMVASKLKGLSNAGGGGQGGQANAGASQQQRQSLVAANQDKIKPGFQDIPISIDVPTFHCEGEKEYKFTLTVNIELKKDDENDDSPTSSNTSTAGQGQNATSTYGPGYPRPTGNVTYEYIPPPTNDYGAAWSSYFSPDIPPPVGIRNTSLPGEYKAYSTDAIGVPPAQQTPPPRPQQPRPKKKAKTANFTASGQLNFVCESDGQKLDFTRVELGCFAIEAEYGPAKLSGGVNILRSVVMDEKDDKTTDDDDDSAKYGKGFKGFIKLDFDAFKGLGVTAVGQFGSVRQGGEEFTYFFVDAEGYFGKGFPITPNTPVASFYGLGGGIRYNMREEEFPEKTNYTSPPDNNDFCKLDDAYLAAGVSLTGAVYAPKKSQYGGKFYVLVGSPSPSQAYMGNLGFDIAISNDDGIKFEKLTILGNAYFLYKEIATYRTEHAAVIESKLAYNFSDKLLTGEFNYKALLGPKEYPIFRAPKDLSEIGDDKYNRGQLFMDFKKGDWDLKFGSWDDPSSNGQGRGRQSPPSGLPYNSHKVTVIPGIGVNIDAYLQAGMNVDPIPPLSNLIPDYRGRGPENSERPASGLYRSGQGIVMGAKISVKEEINLLVLYGELKAGIGFDATLRKVKPPACDPDIGLKNWYIQGQAYAYFSSTLKLDAKVFGIGKTFDVFDMRASVIAQAQFPNPSYFAGEVHVYYDVAGGLYKDDFREYIELGQKPCGKPLNEDFRRPNPIANIQVFDSCNPANEDTEVGVFTNPEITTRFSLNQHIEIPIYNSDGEEKGFEKYLPTIKKLELKLVKLPEGGNADVTLGQVKFNRRIEPSGKKIELLMSDLLADNGEYELHYEFIWQKLVNGVYEDAVDEDTGKKFIDKGIAKFTTGSLGRTIEPVMLRYAAPGDRQRFWTKGYADPVLKFVPKMANHAHKLFPPTSKIQQKDVDNEYVVKLVQLDPDPANIKIEYINIDYYPRKTDVLERKIATNTVGSFSLPVITYGPPEEGREVRFSALDNVDLTPKKIYRLSILKRPLLNSKGGEKLSLEQKRIRDLYTEEIYTIHFGVGEKTIEEKLNVQLLPVFPKKEGRSDFNSAVGKPKRNLFPNESAATSIKDAIKVKDGNYYWILPDDLTEKEDYFFDYYDLNRIDRNMQVSYKEEYPLERVLVPMLYKNPPFLREPPEMYSFFYALQNGASSLSGGPINSDDTKKYKTFLSKDYKSKSYTGLERPGRYFDFIPAYYHSLDNPFNLLEDTEIAQGVYKESITDTKIPEVSSSTYTLKLEDYRSRIRIRQSRLWSYLCHVVGENEDYYVDKNILDKASVEQMKVDEKGASFFRGIGLPDFTLWAAGKRSSSDSYTTPEGYSLNEFGEEGSRLNYTGKLELKYPISNNWETLDDADRGSANYIRFEVPKFLTFSGLNDLERKYPPEIKDDVATTPQWAPINQTKGAIEGYLLPEYSTPVELVYFLDDDNRLVLMANNRQKSAMLFPKDKAPLFIKDQLLQEKITDDDFQGGEMKGLKFSASSYTIFKTEAANDLLLQSGEYPDGFEKRQIGWWRDYKVIIVLEDGSKWFVDKDKDKFAPTDFKPCEGENCDFDNQTVLPFENRPQSMPGVLQLGYFDMGGQGVSYVAPAGNNGNYSLRKSEDVDLYDNGDGQIYLAEKGKCQIDYTVKFEQAGPYIIRIKYAVGGDKKSPRLSTNFLDNQQLDATLQASASGIQYAYFTTFIKDANKIGKLRINWDTNGGRDTRLYNIEYIKIPTFSDIENVLFNLLPQRNVYPVKQLGGDAYSPHQLFAFEKVSDEEYNAFYISDGQQNYLNYDREGIVSFSKSTKLNWGILPIPNDEGVLECVLYAIAPVESGAKMMFLKYDQDNEKLIVIEQNGADYTKETVFTLEPSEMLTADLEASSWEKVVFENIRGECSLKNLFQTTPPAYIYMHTTMSPRHHPVFWSRDLRTAYVDDGKSRKVYNDVDWNVDVLQKSVSLNELFGKRSRNDRQIVHIVDDEGRIYRADNSENTSTFKEINWKEEALTGIEWPFNIRPVRGIRLPRVSATAIPGTLDLENKDWGGPLFSGAPVQEGETPVPPTYLDFPPHWANKYTVNVESPGVYVMDIKYSSEQLDLTIGKDNNGEEVAEKISNTALSAPSVLRVMAASEKVLIELPKPEEGKESTYRALISFQQAGSQLITVSSSGSNKIERIVFRKRNLPSTFESLIDNYISFQEDNQCLTIDDLEGDKDGEFTFSIADCDQSKKDRKFQLPAAQKFNQIVFNYPDKDGKVNSVSIVSRKKGDGFEIGTEPYIKIDNWFGAGNPERQEETQRQLWEIISLDGQDQGNYLFRNRFSGGYLTWTQKQDKLTIAVSHPNHPANKHKINVENEKNSDSELFEKDRNFKGAYRIAVYDQQNPSSPLGYLRMEDFQSRNPQLARLDETADPFGFLWEVNHAVDRDGSVSETEYEIQSYLTYMPLEYSYMPKTRRRGGEWEPRPVQDRVLSITQGQASSDLYNFYLPKSKKYLGISDEANPITAHEESKYLYKLERVNASEILRRYGLSENKEYYISSEGKYLSMRVTINEQKGLTRKKRGLLKHMVDTKAEAIPWKIRWIDGDFHLVSTTMAMDNRGSKLYAVLKWLDGFYMLGGSRLGEHKAFKLIMGEGRKFVFKAHERTYDFNPSFESYYSFEEK